MHDGIILIDKPRDYTSRDVVNIISKKYHTKKVGHTGTLDPLATGVLVICIGKATKLVDYLTSTYKEYVAEFELGIKTDTLDITGNVIEKKSQTINQSQIEEVLKNMVGTYEQEVPIYSAVKINGKKLYEYARENIEVELPKRMVDIKTLELISFVDNKITIKTTVSKGTYIRSLINDICTKLNTVGTMTKLTRTKQGEFKLEDCSDIDNIKKIISIEEVLKNIYEVKVDEKLEKQIRNGAIIDNIYNENLIKFTKCDKILATYRTYSKDSHKLRPDKMFIGGD